MKFIRYLNLYRVKRRGAAIMHMTYRTDVHERRIGDVAITISNITPVYCWEEKAVAKKKIEQQLYEIFCKYVSVKS